MTDRFKTLGHQVVDLCFRIRRVGGSFADRQASDGNGETLGDVRMVSLDEVEACGFSKKFVDLVRSGFPEKGHYAGEFHALYG